MSAQKTSQFSEILKRIKQKLTKFRILKLSQHGNAQSPNSYALYPKLTESQMSSYEATNKIELPIEYRIFLKEIGNGAIEQASAITTLFHLQTDSKISTIAQHFPFQKISKVDIKFEKKNYSDDIYENFVIRKPYVANQPDAIQLSHEWPGILALVDNRIDDWKDYYFIVISGENKGTVWRNTSTQIELVAANFLAFYENCLDLSINKLVEQHHKNTKIFSEYESKNPREKNWRDLRIYLLLLQTYTLTHKTFALYKNERLKLPSDKDLILVLKLLTKARDIKNWQQILSEATFIKKIPLDVMLNISEIYVQIGDTHSAIKILNKINAKLKITNQFALHIEGAFQWAGMKQYKRAYEMIAPYIKAKRSNLETFFRRLTFEKRNFQAIVYSSKLAKIAKKGTQLEKHRLGWAYAQLKMYGPALYWFKKSLRVKPYSQDNIAWMYFKLEKYQKGINYLNNRKDAWALNQLGACYSALKNYDIAMTYFTNSFKIDHNLRAYSNIAYTLIHQRNFVEAEKVLNNLLDSDPYYAYGHYFKACLYGLQKKEALALECIKQAYLCNFDRQEIEEESYLQDIIKTKSYEIMVQSIHE